jgi:glycosyltransferase involved in cell wall biosynthesis
MEEHLQSTMCKPESVRIPPIELRKQFRLGQLTKNRFIFLAAQEYAAEGKPHRALALLDSSDIADGESAQIAILQRTIGAPPPPACSLNMIVRDEEANLGPALDSIDAIADEIVICDTGSIDATLAIARLYGATIIGTTWQNDFSLARNRAIEASRGDWILWMDADDRFEPSSTRTLQTLVGTAQPQAAAFCIVNRIPDKPDVEFLQTRLFPRRADLRFERRIHEQIMFSAHTAGVPLTRHDAIRIIHTGYHDPQLCRSKALRNKKIIETELQNAPDDPTLWLSLGDSCMLLDEPDAAMRAYTKVCRDESLWQTNRDVFVQAHVNCGLIAARQADEANALRFLYRALFLDNTRVEAWYHLARILLRRGRERQAVDFLVKAATINVPLRLTASANRKIRLEAINMLAEILLRQGRYESAKAILTAAIKEHPRVPRYYTLLGRAQTRIGNYADAAACFKASLDLCAYADADACNGMAEIYQKLGDRQSALKWQSRCCSVPAMAD